MSDKIKKIIKIIGEIFNGIAIFITIFAMVLVFLGRSSINMFIYASFLYLGACCLNLIINKRDDKRLTYLGMFLMIALVVAATFCITNVLKWASV